MSRLMAFTSDGVLYAGDMIVQILSETLSLIFRQESFKLTNESKPSMLNANISSRKSGQPILASLNNNSTSTKSFDKFVPILDTGNTDCGSLWMLQQGLFIRERMYSLLQIGSGRLNAIMGSTGRVLI